MVVSRQPIFVNLKSNTMKKHVANIIAENVFYKWYYNKKLYINKIYIFILLLMNIKVRLNFALSLFFVFFFEDVYCFYKKMITCDSANENVKVT